MPNAQVVADRFHVMTQINQELDTQRKTEKRNVEELIKPENLAAEKAKYKLILEGLKNSKSPLLKNEENLNEEQLNKLIQVKNISTTLKVMHQLKEKLEQFLIRLMIGIRESLNSVCGYRELKNIS